MTMPASDELEDELQASADSVGFFLRDLQVVVRRNRATPRYIMQKSASQTKRLSGTRPEHAGNRTEPMMSTPPIVGVPCFAPCNSARRCTSAAVRIGWPILSEISFRMTKLPKAGRARTR